MQTLLHKEESKIELVQFNLLKSAFQGQNINVIVYELFYAIIKNLNIEGCCYVFFDTMTIFRTELNWPNNGCVFH